MTLTTILLLFALATPAIAHSPSQVVLAYDNQNQSLNVTVTHTTNNPTVHYVKEIVVERNGTEALKKEYENQTASTFSYNYLLNATAGDVLKATALCSISGSRSAEITVQ